MKNIYKIFTSLIILVVLGSVAYSFKNKLTVHSLPILADIQNEVDAVFAKPPCTEPLPYTVGTLDTKFGISKDYFLSALADAEAVWEKPLGKDFFTYAPASSSSSVLKINLVYDSRQEATGKLASLGIVVKENKTSYNSLKTRYASLEKSYSTEKDAFNAKVNDFNKKEKAYNAEVSYWNREGGATDQEYNKLEIEHASLQAESVNIKLMQTMLNGEADEINALVVALNHLVSVLNLSVQNYNTTIGLSPGEVFEEGVYLSDGVNRQINIYEFTSRAMLVRALAHELGHALGLEHVDDSNAIMYKVNEGKSLKLTSADIAELQAKCNLK